MAYEETTINVAWGYSEKEGKVEDKPVLAYMVGDYLAVHESLEEKDEGWIITHVPTGFAVKKFIGRNEALYLADEIKDIIDWNFSEPEDALNVEGYRELLDKLFPDRTRKPDPILEDFETEWERPSNPTKLELLFYIEGFNNEMEFMETFITDTLCPGICMNADCEYTAMYEQDQNEGWCEICDTGTVKSGMLLMGMI